MSTDRTFEGADWPAALVDELGNILDNAPVWPGDTISHATANELVRRGLAERSDRGDGGCGDFVPCAGAADMLCRLGAAGLWPSWWAGCGGEAA